MTRKFSNALMTIVAATFVTGISFSKPAAAVEPFLGQIEYFGFNFPPRGWAPCDGQILPIDQNQSLFSLLGVAFGGDGRTSFALPDMRGRVPVHDGGSAGSGLTRRVLGATGGSEQVSLTASQLPAHSHSLRGTTNAADQATPGGNTLADDSDVAYRNEAPNTDMHAGSIGATPTSAHNNMPPFLVLNCNIALTGTFPSRN